MPPDPRSLTQAPPPRIISCCVCARIPFICKLSVNVNTNPHSRVNPSMATEFESRASHLVQNKGRKVEVDALGVIAISRGCVERCCSNRKTPPYHSNLRFATRVDPRATASPSRASRLIKKEQVTRTKKHSPNTGARANNNIHRSQKQRNTALTLAHAQTIIYTGHRNKETKPYYWRTG